MKNREVMEEEKGEGGERVVGKVWVDIRGRSAGEGERMRPLSLFHRPSSLLRERCSKRILLPLRSLRFLAHRDEVQIETSQFSADHFL